MQKRQVKKLKVLLINDNFNELGGAERIFHLTCRILKEKKNKTFQFSFSYDFGEKNKNIYIYHDKKRSNFVGKFLRSYLHPLVFFKLLNYIHSVQPDIIHLHKNFKYGNTVLLALKVSQVPVVHTVHDFGPLCPLHVCTLPDGKVCKGNFGLKCLTNRCLWVGQFFFETVPQLMQRCLLKTVVKIFISPSNVLKDSLENSTFKNVILLRNIIEIDENILRKKPKRVKNQLIFVGALVDHKGLPFLIQALKIVKTSFPKIRLLIIGEGPKKEEYKELVKKGGLNNQVFFLGKTDNKHTLLHMAKSAILVMPSIWMENAPITLLEAMVLGTPAIGSKIGGIPELIKDRETGLLFKPRDSIDLADKIIYLLSHPKIARRMGQKSIEICQKNYIPEIYYEKLIKVYKKAASKE